MASTPTIHLTVLSDDFGMCQAVNEGIVQAFTQGVLTDANLMAPCPAFDEAVRLAKAHKIPVGIHNTFTAEWDYLRWSPLTSAKSMIRPDGTFHTTVEGAWKNADLKEAEKEFLAQWDKVSATGLSISHACEHMGAEEKLAGLFGKILKLKKVPYRNYSLDGDRWGIPHYQWDSIFQSSDKGTELFERKKMLKEWLDSIGPGYHLWGVHSAIDHPSLEGMCKPTHGAIHWARLYRVLDQYLLLDPEVKEWLKERGIQLVPMRQVPVVGF